MLKVHQQSKQAKINSSNYNSLVQESESLTEKNQENLVNSWRNVCKGLLKVYKQTKKTRQITANKAQIAPISQFFSL